MAGSCEGTVSTLSQRATSAAHVSKNVAVTESTNGEGIDTTERTWRLGIRALGSQRPLRASAVRDSQHEWTEPTLQQAVLGGHAPGPRPSDGSDTGGHQARSQAPQTRCPDLVKWLQLTALCAAGRRVARRRSGAVWLSICVCATHPGAPRSTKCLRGADSGGQYQSAGQ